MEWKKYTRLTAAALAGAAMGLAVPAMGDEANLAVIEIEGTPASMQNAMSMFGGGEQTLLGLIETFDTLAYDDEFDGVLIRLKDSGLSMTMVEEIGAAMDRVREAGKQIHVFAEGYGTGELLLGAHADELIMQQGGGVSIPGLHMEEMFLADTLDWVGLKAQFIQVGDYKGANEALTRTKPSKAWSENINGLLDSLYANQRAAIMEGRGLSEAQLDKAMEACWWADGDQSIAAGVIDAEVDLSDLKDHLAGAFGTEKVAFTNNPYEMDGPGLDMANPLMVFAQIFGQQSAPSIDEPTIAVLHVEGQIVDGDSSNGGMFGGASTVGSRTIRNAIKDLIKEDMIEGVIVRIDSPGGSAIASEVMWQGLDRLSAEKPVWVSVGNMAASGGMYVLSGGDKVYVNPSSIVGSIGVVGGKIAMGGLYDKIKINVVEHNRGPRSGLMSSASLWDDSEQDMIRSKMKETYDLFASRVVAGREGIDLSKTAEGRLFTGEVAVGLKMADEVGGLDDAINDLAGELGIAPGSIMHYPEPPSFEQMLEEMFGGFAQAPGVAMVNPAQAALEALRPLLGDDRIETVREALNGVSLLRDEPVLCISPRVLHFSK